MKVKEMMEIFEAGKQVANPTYWKQKTIDMNKLILVLSGLVGIINMFDCSMCNIQLSPDQLIGIATGLISAVSVFNMGSTAATTTKVGLIGKKKVDSKLAADIEKLQ